MSIILGIDPGSRFTGYGLLKVSENSAKSLQSGVISIPQTLNLAQKLDYLEQELHQLMSQWRPQTAVIENIFLGKNVSSVFKLGHVRGVCMAVSARHGAEVVEYAARKVKKVITGTGAAEKEQVRRVLMTLLQLKDNFIDLMDATDALALAYCHYVEQRTQTLIEKQGKGLQL